MSTFSRSAALVRVRQQLLEHPMYQSLTSLGALRHFMGHHVFAVWDFMSLVKSLQQTLTVTTVPWTGGKVAGYARMINEIVLAEESDADGGDGYASHFELYLQAMRQCGADVRAIEGFTQALAHGQAWPLALSASGVPSAVARFVEHTLQIAIHGQPHQVAAAFFFGREEVIPDMFKRLVEQLAASGQACDRFVYYLNRHILTDGEVHGPMALQLMQYFCGSDARLWAEAEATAVACLEKRIQLWTHVDQSWRASGLSIALNQAALETRDLAP